MRLPLDPSLASTNQPSMTEPSLHSPGYSMTTKALKWRTGACVLIALTSMTGCRSSMPKFNMFGFKSEPSADALAGVGPTSTYPVSPASGISPEAIASTAAGTAAPSGMKPQTSNIAAAAGSTTPPGTPATNPAAASANGFYGASGTKPSTAATPASYASATGPSGGFTYGQNPNAGKTNAGIAAIPAGYAPNKPAVTASGLPAYAQTTPSTATATPAATATTPAYTAVPGYPLPGGTMPPATTVPVSAAPSQFASAPAPSAAPSSPTTTSPPAFAMPPLAGSTAASSTPSSSTTTGGGFTMPTDAAAPTTNVASLPSSPRAAAPTAPSTGGYKPGSTAGAVSYPAGDYPSTGQSDTFYR